MQAANTITVNGVEYVRADSVPPRIEGHRNVLVCDRGWIFAGDETKGVCGESVLERAIGVRRWEGVGFNGMIADPTKKVILEPMSRPVIIPSNSVLFRVPVADSWGL